MNSGRVDPELEKVMDDLRNVHKLLREYEDEAVPARPETGKDKLLFTLVASFEVLATAVEVLARRISS